MAGNQEHGRSPTGSRPMTFLASSYVGRTDLHCWGLVCSIYREYGGIELPEYGEVNSKEMQAIAGVVGKSSNEHPWYSVTPFPGTERSFDVVVMKGWLPCEDGVNRRGVIHTGVVTRRGYVLHTDMGYAVVEVPLGHPTVRRRLVGCYRHWMLLDDLPR